MARKNAKSSDAESLIPPPVGLPIPMAVSMVFDGFDVGEETPRALYRQMLYTRLIEEKMLLLLRQNRISKWFSGIGQEAIAVGSTMALQDQDWIFPLHRNLGVFTSRGFPLAKLFAQWQGKADGYTRGRDRSFHFGYPAKRVIGMISHLGAMLGVADGAVLGNRLSGGSAVALAYSGDGGTSEGEVHEAINLAAVWDLPVIFLIENNGYGLSTPTREQYRCTRLAERALGYGIEGLTIDGNNVLEVYQTVQYLAQDIRQRPRPVILECVTFRMRGHEEASGTRYVPQELFDWWGQRDPLQSFEAWLRETNIMTAADQQSLRAELKAQINAEVEPVFDWPEPQPDAQRELADVYAKRTTPPRLAPTGAPARELRVVDALREAHQLALRENPKLVIMGQDVAEYGGVFKVTEGLVDEFGKDRIRNTPLCEAGVIAAALGLTLEGWRAIVEMQFADFVSCGFNQIVNNLAKTHYRWHHAVPSVIRLPTGGGMAAGPFHSQSTEGWFAQVPGLRIVYPSTAADAKGLLLAAVREPNPVLYFEHKGLYRSQSDSVPEGWYEIPIGQGRIVQSGHDLTIITYGMGVRWALEACSALPMASIEIVDLRSLQPIDWDLCFESVQRTNKCLVLHEATFSFGIGAELAARIGSECFRYLDAPVMRVGALDTPVPFHAKLETDFMPYARFLVVVSAMLEY